MAINARTRRNRRTAVLVGGLAVAGIVALPAAAYANSVNSGNLAPGAEICVSQNANYQARVDGTATAGGAKFLVYKDFSQIAQSSPTATLYGGEFRTSNGTFAGKGSYTICAINKQSTKTYVTLQVRTDAELP